jgi:outer membrane protein
MKKVIVLAFVAVGLWSSAAAQAPKFGYISSEELMAAMPEVQKMQKDLQEYAEVLELKKVELEKKLMDLDSILTKTDTMPPKMPSARLKLYKEDYGKYYVEYQQFDNKARQDLEAKQNELLAPIRDKALKTIQTVAKTNGYTYVFYKEQIIVYPAADDILPLCKKSLGIVDKPAAAPQSPKAGMSPR